jgi:polysaccharide export outer membrane protein
LFLTFPLSPEFNQTVTVQPDGYINLQNMQSVYAVGMTVPEVVTALKAAYSGTLHAPIINVDLVDFQKPFFTVTGQVGKPGQYELRANITAEEALATAGGMSPTAKTQVLLFRRRPDSSFEMRKLNIKAALAGNHEEDNPLLQPGDMLFVPEKFITNFKKYVPYTTSTGTYVSP